MLSPGRFKGCCTALGAEHVPSSVFTELAAAYAEPHRCYHTARHLSECLAEFDGAAAHAQHPAEVEFGLWFHDAVYDTRDTDNELRSAAWAREALRTGGADAKVAERVHDLILASTHDAAPETPDARLLVDVDLAILGQDQTRFDEYQAQIRSEYASVPKGESHCQARLRILQGFLGRDRIYCTQPFFDRLEAHARENLDRASRELGGGP